MQNAGLAALGLDWRYVAGEVHPDDLRAAIEGARAMKFVGLNLTVPHKLLAVGMVDALDESARVWGAVNTIRFEAHDAEGRWVSSGKSTAPSTAPSTPAASTPTPTPSRVRSAKTSASSRTVRACCSSARVGPDESPLSSSRRTASRTCSW